MAENNTTQKSGYLEIKQSSKVKGRKMKTWRKRWVVVKKMTDLTAGTQSARVDVYTHEPSSSAGQNRMTFVLDQLIAVQSASSKTHPFAFELVEMEPVLVLSGASKEESEEWMTALCRIFFAGDIFSDTDSYNVTIQPNKASLRFDLNGKYILSISPEGVYLKTRSTRTQYAAAKKWQTLENPSPNSRRRSSGSDHVKGPLRDDSSGSKDGEEEEEEEEGEVVEVLAWRLSMLKRFYVDRDSAVGQRPVFVLDCGPNSSTGEAIFRFITEKAFSILASIRKSISIAMERRKSAGHTSPHNSETNMRSRTISTVLGYQTLLDSSARGVHAAGIGEEVGHERANSRSGSTSSGSTMTSVTPTAGDLGMEHAKSGQEEKGLPIKQRISVVSVPPGFFSSSPKSSDVFGPDLPPQRPQELHMQQSWWQMQQTAPWPQQQQQVNGILPGSQIPSPTRMSPQSPLSPQSPPSQQLPLSPLSQQPPPPPISAQSSLSPPPTPLSPQGNPQQFFPLDEHRQQLQLWIQQQPLHQHDELDEWPQDTGRSGMIRNSSVPNVASLVNECKAFDNDVFTRMRTGSMTTEGARASGSVCSADSGVVVTNPRKGSSSFGSTVSTESSASARKISSDGVGTVLESPTSGAMESPPPLPPKSAPIPTPNPRPQAIDHEDKATPQDGSLHIYQDLDSVKFEGSRRCSRRGSSTYDMGRRRHSTGEMSHDYEELDAVKRNMALICAHETSEAKKVDQPPELPARPSFFQKRNFKSALGVWNGLRSLTVKDRKGREPDSDETLTSSKVKEGVRSLFGSNDLYSTICDDDARLHRRSSSDFTPVSSYPDLCATADSPLTFRPKPAAPVLSGSVDTRAVPDAFFSSDGLGKKSITQSFNLLSFSETDVSQTSPSDERLGQGVSPDKVVDSKAALMDFFLDDVSFHSNPMVTGDFKTTKASSTNTVSSPADSWNQSPFPASSQPVAAEGWADFTDQNQKMGFQASSDPWTEVFSWTPAMLPGDASKGEGSGQTESVYIDMRTKDQGESEKEAACDYVAPGGLSKDQAIFEFILYQ